VRRLLLAIVLLGVAVAAGLALDYRSSYGAWWPADPDRLRWCERTYFRGTAATHSARELGTRLYPAFTAAGDGVFAESQPQDRTGNDRESCGNALYREVERDRYDTYVLSGSW
jgi:hypothetical protein